MILQLSLKMTNRLELNWKLDGFVDEQRYYCSEAPINPISLPNPKVVLPGDVRSYIDTAITFGLAYYVRIGSVKNGVEKLSEEILVLASDWSPSLIHFTPKIFLDDVSMLSSGWNSQTDSNYNFTVQGGVSAPLIVENSLNGRAVMRFTGSHGFQSNINTTKAFAKSKKHVYGFVVTKLNMNSNSYKRLFCISGTSKHFSNSKFTLFNGNVSGLQYWAQTCDSNNTEISSNFFTSNDFEMLLLYTNHEAGNISLYRNGVKISELSVSTTYTMPNVDAVNPISIGYYVNNLGGKTQFTYADIACFVANDESITQQEIDKIFGWAAHRYGLTNNLPMDHPYKSIAP